jgi:hypothetical protein
MDRRAASVEPLRGTMTSAHPQKVELEGPGLRPASGSPQGFRIAQFVATAQELGPDALGRPDDRGRLKRCSLHGHIA